MVVLVEASTFMKGEPDIVGFYKTRYDEALEGLKQLADGRNKEIVIETVNQG